MSPIVLLSILRCDPVGAQRGGGQTQEIHIQRRGDPNRVRPPGLHVGLDGSPAGHGDLAGRNQRVDLGIEPGGDPFLFVTVSTSQA